MERNQRRPPDVNEALSSMLWTPYERTPSDSSSDDDEKLNAKLKRSRSSFDYTFPTKTQYVPSCRKIQRYDNFRFSYPYYGPIPTVQKCITELPSYESLYHNVTPALSSITGLRGRLVHSFTDNFITETRPSSTTAVCDTATTILRITSSMSGFSNNFTDEDYDEDADDCDESSNNNVVPTPCADQSSGSATSSRQLLAPISSGNVFDRSCVETKGSIQQSCIDPDTVRQSDNNGDLLLTKNNNISERQQPRKYQQQQQRQSDLTTAQTITKRQDVAFVVVVDDLPGEVRVSKPGEDHQSGSTGGSSLNGDSDSEQHRSCAAIVDLAPSTTTLVAIANPCTREKPETKCARSAQTDVVCSATGVSTTRLVEDFRSTPVLQAAVFDAFDLHGYDFVPSESVDDGSLTLDVRRPLLAMRLNIPAASPSILHPPGKGVSGSTGNNIAAISTTSVFLPSSNDSSTGIGRRTYTIANTNANANDNNNSATTVSTGAIVQSKPSLTIQVNQSNDNPGNRGATGASSGMDSVSKSHDHVVNQSTGISVVNCYSGSSVPNSCSVSGGVPSVVTTTTKASATTTTVTGSNVSCCSVTNSLSDCDNSASVQITGLPSPPAPVPAPAPIADLTQNQHRPLARTFTSTECQTDDLHLDRGDPNLSTSSVAAGITQSQTEALISREQRRRERRERRQQGRNRHPHILPHMHPASPIIRPNMLPDILHSHYPPPYTALSSLTNPPPPPPSSLITPVISTVPIPATAVTDGRFTIPLPVIRRSPSERSGKGCCGQWFAGPPLRALIAVVALGGVACALGGAALGATAPPTSHLTAALLMIGVGVILVTVSAAAWRMTAPGGRPCLGLGSTVDLARCGRRPCNSRGAPHGLLYPEFQHRQPPPSYQASMQEYRLRLLLLDRDRQNGVVRGGSPPPTYRSHAGSLLRAPLTTTTRNGCGPGSEYSLPPSYRSRNVNMNTNPHSTRPSAGPLGDESVESLRRNNNTNASSLSPGNVPQYHTTATRALVEQLQSTMSTIPEPSAISTNFDNCATSTTSTITATTATTRTKDSVHTIAIEAGATTPNVHTQNQSQNINEKFNPRVTNSNNKINRISSCSSSGSLSCTKGSSSGNNPVMKSTATSTTGEQTTMCPVNNRKELVTIVTISACQGPEPSPSEMEILAHL